MLDGDGFCARFVLASGLDQQLGKSLNEGPGEWHGAADESVIASRRRS